MCVCVCVCVCVRARARARACVCACRFQNLTSTFFLKSLFKNYAGLPVFYVIQMLKEFQRSLHTTSRLHWTRNTQSSQRNRNAQEQSRYRTDITTVWLLEELGEHEVRSLLTSHLLHCAIYIHLYVYTYTSLRYALLYSMCKFNAKFSVFDVTRKSSVGLFRGTINSCTSA